LTPEGGHPIPAVSPERSRTGQPKDLDTENIPTLPPAKTTDTPLNPRDQICIYPFKKYEKIEKNRKKLAKS
jgi:hypothetical protein